VETASGGHIRVQTIETTSFETTSLDTTLIWDLLVCDSFVWDHIRCATKGKFGHLPPTRKFQNTAWQFWHLQKLSKNKDGILYS